MKRRNVHQWRNWLLEYIGEDKYELIQKDTLAVRAIVAKNAIDAENICRKIIDSTKEAERANVAFGGKVNRVV